MDKERWQQIKWEKDNALDKFKLHEQEYVAEGFTDPPESKKVKKEEVKVEAKKDHDSSKESRLKTIKESANKHGTHKKKK